MGSDNEFKVLSYTEFNTLPDIRTLSGEVPRAVAAQVASKLDVLELSIAERVKKLMSFWDYYHILPESVIKKDHSERIPESMMFEVIHEDRPNDPADPKYDYLVYLEMSKGYGEKKEYILKKLQKFNPAITLIAGGEEELEKCPCCGYRTLDQRGMYFICDVCAWEDDGADRDEEYSGPNHMTLGEGRDNFRKFGVCDKRLSDLVDQDGTTKYKQ
ncbi:MAG: hypothetical protein M0P22_02950 [Methanoculleus sp.]|nr:hypothetical protein [Methanoculleus sp.]